MKDRPTVSAAILFLISIALACSLTLNFDRQGQPCDSRGQCLAGYRCVDRVCVARADDCGGCPSGQVCTMVSHRCVPNTCEYKHCPVGQSCSSDDAGAPRCSAISPYELGSRCDVDSRCEAAGPNRVCLQNSLASGSYSTEPRPGICVEKCSPVDAGCTAIAARCRKFTLGLDSGVSFFCIGDNVVLPCTNDSQCADDGLVCAVFDHPTIGPTTLCDAPMDAGSTTGQACRLTQDVSGAAPCANGLCLHTSAGPLCGELCDAPTCSDGKPCKLVEFTIGRIPRQIPACSSDATICLNCSDPREACGADAPHCVSLGPTNRCLLGCSLDGGAVIQNCPAGYRCVSQDAGVFCIPAPVPICP